MRRWLSILLLVSWLAPGSIALQAQGNTFPDAEIVNDEGGVALVTGDLIITNPNVKIVGEEPLIVLEDQAGFIDRDIDYELPLESQVLGQILGDYQADEAIAYRLALPIIPGGGLRNVANDGRDDGGVMVFQVSYNRNSYGDPFLEGREMRGWSGAYSSAIVSEDPRTYLEIVGGNLLVYAPDDQQGFPSGFGPDGLLFTEDDPIVRLPQGYTAVNLDADPFTFDRSREVSFTLYEPESLEINDFSSMTYTEAFDALINVGKREYSFTESKDVDWDALAAEFRPRFEEAERNNDVAAYLFALRDLTWRIPDEHISISEPTGTLTRDFLAQTDGGLGLSLVELDDERILVNFLLQGGPAAGAGMQLGATILDINGVPIQEAISANIPYSSPFSAPHTERIQQLRYVIRFPVDTQVELTFQNPDGQPQTVTLTTIPERESFSFSSILRGASPLTAPPIEYEFLDSGYAYVRINSFSGNERLIMAKWDYFMQQVRATNAPGIIMDIRFNGGGFSFIGRRIASYFYDREIDLYFSQSYNKDIDEFFYDERFPNTLPLSDPELRYDGPLAILIAPGCASACEFFAYNFIPDDRAAFVGQYPTRAIAGGWFPTRLPGGVQLALPSVRPVDLDGETIIIEGVGIVPTVRVPVDETTVFSDADVVREAAIAYLDELLTAEIIDGGTVSVGDVISGSIEPRTRVQYRFTFPGGRRISVFAEATGGQPATIFDQALGGDDDLDLVISILNNTGAAVLAQNDDAGPDTLDAALEGLSAGEADFQAIIEVSTLRDRGSGDFQLRIVDVTDETGE